jgi:hypothetical protein
MTFVNLNDGYQNGNRATIKGQSITTSKNIADSSRLDVIDNNSKVNIDITKAITKRRISETILLNAEDFNETQNQITSANLTALGEPSYGSTLFSTDPVTPYAFYQYYNLTDGNGKWAWISSELVAGQYPQFQIILIANIIYARISDNTGFTWAGDSDGPTVPSHGDNFKIITPNISSVNGIITGSFILEYLSDGKLIQVDLS